MAHLYLTRKQIQNQQFEALTASGASNSIVAAGTDSAKHNPNFQSNASIITSIYVDHDVEDLDMLLEAYFMQLDGTRNKILLVSSYLFSDFTLTEVLLLVFIIILNPASLLSD